MVILKEKQPFASGGHFLVFTHPANSAYVIKAVKPEYNYNNISRFSLRKFLFRRYKHYVDCVRIVTGIIPAYLGNDKHPDFLQHFYGFEITDLGLAIVAKAERDQAGGYAPTLKKLLEEGKFDDTAQKELEIFFEELLGSAVVVSDLSADNIVYSWNDEKGKSRFVLIDGLGEKNTIPLRTYFSFFNYRAKLRGIKRIRRKIEQYPKCD
jgi:hypothetical protein